MEMLQNSSVKKSKWELLGCTHRVKNVCQEGGYTRFLADVLAAPQYQWGGFQNDGSKTVLSRVWESGVISAGPGV